MLEKLAPALLAGVPVVDEAGVADGVSSPRPSSASIVASGRPPGGCGAAALRLASAISSTTSTGQDIVGFTGSASTRAQQLRAHPSVVRQLGAVHGRGRLAQRRDPGAVRATPGTAEFDLYVKEVVRELTVKAGQKCTAVRRALVPARAGRRGHSTPPRPAGEVTVGDPAREDVRMGPLASLDQRDEVRRAIDRPARRCRGRDRRRLLSLVDADSERGALPRAHAAAVAPKPDAPAVHSVEAFGPVAHGPALRLARRRGRPRGAGRRQPGRVGVRRGPRRGQPPRARHRQPPRPGAGRRRALRPHPHGPRLAAARTWCTADPVAPAAARSSAACAACGTTCSARRSRARPSC